LSVSGPLRLSQVLPVVLCHIRRCLSLSRYVGQMEVGSEIDEDSRRTTCPMNW
jgi:hypothetical protein